MCGICGIVGFTETPAEAAGRLARIHVREGEAVGSGQLLAEIEPEGA